LEQMTEKKLTKIWLSSPHMGEHEFSFVKEAFDTNWIAPLGPNVDAFETELSARLNGYNVAALNSGTSALHLSLRLLDVSAGDEVICQSFTFSASANPIVYQGATPVFVDSESSTWNMDPVIVKEAIEHRLSLGKSIKAIIAVDLYGMPAQLAEIAEIAACYGIPMIEDAAEAIGSSINAQPCGTFGHLAALSFNGNKIITTSGGGALVSSDPALIVDAKYLATQARDPAPHYQHSQIGYNYRMSNVLAGIGRGQLLVLNDRIAARRRNYERYFHYFSSWNLKGFDIQFQLEPEGYFSNRWLSCILVEPQKNKGLTVESIRLALEAENIECRPLWKPMHLQPVFSQMPFYGAGISEKLFDIGLCLPSGSNLSEEDFSRIFGCLDKLFLQF
jgi:dTDP-4-amino-4,6-dideoxygalactose transaminase